jgi:A/G-specific adenine glycosylase
MPADFASRLLKWYAHQRRALPWRESTDPYRVWVAEIMLQQTQVQTVLPYYARWLERFPTLQALAAAPQAAVLAAWEGLGYYSRARNLHRAAQQVVAHQAGQLPRTPAELLALPGIGRYTAGAIASIAFGADAAVLDGNVKRVLARVFDITEDVKSPSGEKRLWALAESLIPSGQAGDYNQALMDLGATICTPRAPACLLCPVRELCAAFRLGVQLERPVMPARPAVPLRTYAAGVVRKGNRILITQRAVEGLLGGLWAFPAVACESNASKTGQRGQANKPWSTCLRKGLKSLWGLDVKVGGARETLLHGFTHFRLALHVYECSWRSGRLHPGAGRWVRIAELANYPMGKADRRIALSLGSTTPVAPN